MWGVVAHAFMVCWMGVSFESVGGQGLLKGNAIPCDSPDGTVIDLATILGRAPNQPCLTCLCSSGSIKCIMETCPELATCPLAEAQTQSKHNTTSEQPPCCPKCRTCTYLGRKRQNDERWRSVEDNCKAMTCKAGIVTTSRLQCFSPCRDENSIRLPGYCCQLCRENPIDEDTAKRDPCLQCDVVQDEWYHCYRLACPVLDCPLNLQRHLPDKCCPECRHPGQRSFRTAASEVPRIAGHCTFQLKHYPLGEVFPVDPCSKCHCQAGGLTCRRFTCPVRECHASAEFLFRPNVCCPFCHFETANSTDGANAIEKAEIPSSSCREIARNGSLVFYKHNSYWKQSTCLNCQCRNGVSACVTEECTPSEPYHCPKGWAKLKPRGQCCSHCEQLEATCSVFGDPHYETFDGLTYSFHGNRSYVLSRECVLDEDDQAAFSVITHHGDTVGGSVDRVSLYLRLIPDKKPTVLQLAEGKTLLENNLLKAIPHNTSIYSAIKNRKGHLEITVTKLGLRLAFDGRGFAELTLSVAANHKGQVCGLCGNFNNDPSDDLWIQYTDYVTNNTQKFGDSWRFKAARAPVRCKTATGVAALTEAKAYDLAQCQVLMENSFFKFCRKKLNVHRYYKNCIKDVCNCHGNVTKPCFCEAIEAYGTECANKYIWHLWQPFIAVNQLPVHPECDTIVKPAGLVKSGERD
uniref:VWFC domain-containing protein n=1 Tax=Panagrellus redivivus TaxID=6233 RepID=A0A7E4VXF7_PANRE